MPRFVILEHDHPERHWDFMLESGEVLRTWRLAEAPRPDCTIPAERITDHRLAYLDYEGPVSGGRGVVSRWDNGTYEWMNNTTDEIAVSLQGGQVQGTAVFWKEEADRWVFRLSTGEIG